MEKLIEQNNMRIGYYNQHFIDYMPLDKNAVDYIQSISVLENNTEQHARMLLGIIGLRGDVHKLPIKSLSGGQKARVAFVALQVQSPHVLFLDEPTNHLDIEAIDGLIEAINNYDGAVINYYSQFGVSNKN